MRFGYGSTGSEVSEDGRRCSLAGGKGGCAIIGEGKQVLCHEENAMRVVVTVPAAGYPGALCTLRRRLRQEESCLAVHQGVGKDLLTCKLTLSKAGMFSMSKIGLVHLGESLEAYNEADMARKLRDVYDIFVFNSTWCWSQDGFYYTNGQKINKEGMRRAKGDWVVERSRRTATATKSWRRRRLTVVNRLTLLLDTDEGVLRFGLNGVLMERAVEQIPAGISFDDGLLEKEKQRAAARLYRLHKKAIYDVEQIGN
eukprot:760452-Hanusia_phi.AAC.4